MRDKIIFLSMGALLIACSQGDVKQASPSLRCDELHPCAAGLICDPDSHRCEMPQEVDRPDLASPDPDPTPSDLGQPPRDLAQPPQDLAQPPSPGPLSRVRGMLRDPMKFASLGTLSVMSGGTVEIDTGARTLKAGGATFTGVNDGGVAVFTFDSISIPAGVTLKLLGNAALALLSRGDATLASDLSVSAIKGTSPLLGGHAGGAGGTGITGSLGSGPKGGGCAAARFSGGFAGFTPAGGGGHGGTSHGATCFNMTGSYGNLLQALSGGSGGGGGASYPFDYYMELFCASDGGNGGGAVELGAAGALRLAGKVSANGGENFYNAAHCGMYEYGGAGGGAGAGGGIRVHAASLDRTGAVSATGGGSGGFSGGAGGRIALLGLPAYRVGDALPGVSAGTNGVLTLEAVTTTLPAGTTLTLKVPTAVTSTLEVAIGANLIVESGATATLGQSDVLPAAGALTVQATGTFNLGTFNQTAAAVSSAGTLALGGGALTVGTSLSLSGGTLQVDVRGSLPGAAAPIRTAGAVTLGGALRVRWTDMPRSGDRFKLIAHTGAAPVRGTFSAVTVTGGPAVTVDYGGGKDVVLVVP